MRRLWIGFVPYALVSVIHIVALAGDVEAIAGPTKLLLMPLLAVAVFWGGLGSRWGTVYTLLLVAIALSWLGDGAGTLFPTVPTVPITPTRPLRVASTSDRAPGSMTPNTGRSNSRCSSSSAAAEAVLQATTTSPTACSSTSIRVIW